MKKIEEYELAEKVEECVEAGITVVCLTAIFVGVFFVAYGLEIYPNSVFLKILMTLIFTFSIGWTVLGIAWMMSGIVFFSSLFQIAFYLIMRKKKDEKKST